MTAPQKKRLGVLGSMVWDRIHARDGRDEPVEEWGGIAYALAAAAAARPADWEIVPILKIGRDLEERARSYLRSLPGLRLETGIRIVAEANNRVELHYENDERRSERMSGGVPPWTWFELEPIMRDLDAFYVNFISGWELELEAAQSLRRAFDRPIYADLHSIFLGIDASGLRLPRPLEHWREWLRCFDIIQVNEIELSMLSASWGDPWRFAADVVGDDLRVLFVTLGARGAAYVASEAWTEQPLQWTRTLAGTARLSRPGAAHSRKFEPREGALRGDPTGCGDVWGATCFLSLLEGATLDSAMQQALDAASRNVRHRGASGLYERLTGRVLS